MIKKLLLLLLLVPTMIHVAGQEVLASKSTAKATTDSLSLPEGTTIQLNAQTKVVQSPANFAYPTGGYITLNGEALINVSSENTKPLVICLGYYLYIRCKRRSKINVKNYAEDSAITISLYTGKAMIETEFQKLRIKPGSRAVIVKNNISVSRDNRISLDTVWRTGRIIASRLTAREYFNLLNRSTPYTIVMPEDWRPQKKITAVLKKDLPISNKIDLFKMYEPFSYNRQDSTFFITPK